MSSGVCVDCGGSFIERRGGRQRCLECQERVSVERRAAARKERRARQNAEGPGTGEVRS